METFFVVVAVVVFSETLIFIPQVQTGKVKKNLKNCVHTSEMNEGKRTRVELLLGPF